ncbi:MAG: endonuclease domain-containing protein [Myxococcota bacterium]
MSIERARRLRRDQTVAEALLWARLRDRRLVGHRFRRQHPVGRYVLDFYCPEARLCVEVDGSQHGGPDDAERDAWLQGQGIRVLRVWNDDVMVRMDQVLEAILDLVKQA